MPAFSSNLSLNFHNNLWKKLKLKLIPRVDHKTEGGAFEEKGQPVPHFQAFTNEEPGWIQDLFALRNALKPPY